MQKKYLYSSPLAPHPALLISTYGMVYNILGEKSSSNVHHSLFCVFFVCFVCLSCLFLACSPHQCGKYLQNKYPTKCHFNVISPQCHLRLRNLIHISSFFCLGTCLILSIHKHLQEKYFAERHFDVIPYIV